MNTNLASCGIKKNVLFILKSSGFNGDRNYQMARMALSLAMDAVPHVLFSANALALAIFDGTIGKPLADFYEQERFIQELGVQCYVVRDELKAAGLPEGKLRPGIITISSNESDLLLKRMDFLITA